MDKEYKGIFVGLEVKLGEHLPGQGLATTIILLEELRDREPHLFKVALKAMQEAYGEKL